MGDCNETREFTMSNLTQARNLISSDNYGVAYIGTNTIVSWDNSSGEDFTTYVVVKKHDDGSFEVLYYNCARN